MFRVRYRTGGPSALFHQGAAGVLLFKQKAPPLVKVLFKQKAPPLVKVLFK
jgi:hypothetical protein